MQLPGGAQASGGAAPSQRRGCHTLAAQKIRRRASSSLHQRQQQVAGVGLGSPLLPSQHHRRMHGACRRAGKTFISVKPEHLHILPQQCVH